MKNNDWRDSLAALLGIMGDAEPEETVQVDETPREQPQQGRLDIVLEKKGRAGKCATIICGFSLDDKEVDRIAADLKRSLGCGGSARGGEILIQGDRREDVRKFLVGKGFKARII